MTSRAHSLVGFGALAAALLAVAACADGGPSGALEPPLPEDAARVLGAGDSGGTITVAVGETFAIALVGVPTAGFVWEPETVPGFLSPAESLSGPTRGEQLQPGFTGGNHWEVLSFRADAPGEGRLALVQHRPWETDEPPADTFEISVRAEY
jgi:inhibitor of cysteine peptidase